MPRPEKVAAVESLSEIFKTARSVVLNDFTGLDVEKITELRKRCREAGVEYRVVKNTLARRGIQGTPAEVLEPFLDGPTALAFSRESENIPAKVLLEFAKENEAPRFKAAVVDGKLLEAQDVEALAKLPTREELLAKILGGIQAPASNLVFVLQGTVRKLLYALEAIREKKAAEGNG
jgi:large subunit ribosomal protein L10